MQSPTLIYQSSRTLTCATGARWRYHAVAALVVMFVAGTGLAVAADLGKALPAPTGKLAVGRVTYFWTDSSRLELNTPDEHDKRELRVELWYPAEASPAAQIAPYFPDLAALSKQLGAESMLLASIKGHTLVGPPIVTGNARFPVLLLSPGMGTNGSQYTAIVEELVSHGYVVATVDHPFQSRAIVYPDGRVVMVAQPGPEELARLRADPENSRQDYREKVELRSADLRFVLDQLQRLDAGQGASEDDKRFAGRFDLERVGVIGHSIGGVAAPEACSDDPRFKASVNMDGHAASLPFFPSQDGNGPRQPFLELTDGPPHPTDQELAKQNVTREEFDRRTAAMVKRTDDLMRTIAGGSYRVTIPGVRHQSFGDAAIWDSGTVEERHRRMQIMRDYVRAFFGKTLLGNEQTLLDAKSSPYSEVTVERFEPSK